MSTTIIEPLRSAMMPYSTSLIPHQRAKRRVIWIGALVLTLALHAANPALATATTKLAQANAADSGPLNGGPLNGGPLDWPFWRGPHYDGTSPETGLIDDFDPRGGKGSNVAWKRDDLGTRSTPIVMGGKLFVLARANAGTDREGERVVCLDANTGKTLWQNRFNVWLSDVPDTRVAWSSVVGDPETGNVYALGVGGLFQCIDGNSGKAIWSIPMHEYFGMLTTYGGRTNFPVLAEDLVIVGGVMTNWGSNAKPAHRLVAFDKRTGAIVWLKGTRIGPYDTNYSAPTVTVINGQKSLVFGSGDGSIWALQPRTGTPIWHYQISRRGLNTSPLVCGNTVYMGHSEENEVGTAMGTVLALDVQGSGKLAKTNEKWRQYEVMLGKSSPVKVGDRLYYVDDRAKLNILAADTGVNLTRELTGKRALTLGGTGMRSSPLAADGKLYLVSSRGDWSIWAIDHDKGDHDRGDHDRGDHDRGDHDRGLKPVNRGRFPRGESAMASPICSHGSVFFTTTGGIYCLRDPRKTPGVSTLKTTPAESPVADDLQGALVQVVPAEVLLQPGASHAFEARLFNAEGQLLKQVPAEFSVEGAGVIDAHGRFQVNADATHQAASIIAKIGNLKGRARVRIVPPLPWTFTFDGLSAPPVTWVGAQYRHVIRDLQGDAAMVKITTIPKGARSRCWFGPSDLSNYTIQADVRGAIANNRMPDIGIIAQGYTLDMQGAAQQLQIRSWAPVLRMAKTIDFAWKPNTWYVMKLRAETRNDRIVLQGKVWPRDQQEPAEWTIQAVDASPNVAGSPGLFGNAKDAELTLDNIKVFSN